MTLKPRRSGSIVPGMEMRQEHTLRSSQSEMKSRTCCSTGWKPVLPRGTGETPVLRAVHMEVIPHIILKLASLRIRHPAPKECHAIVPAAERPREGEDGGV